MILALCFIIGAAHQVVLAFYDASGWGSVAFGAWLILGILVEARK